MLLSGHLMHTLPHVHISRKQIVWTLRYENHCRNIKDKKRILSKTHVYNCLDFEHTILLSEDNWLDIAKVQGSWRIKLVKDRIAPVTVQ